MTLVAINNKQTIAANSALLCMPVKVLQPLVAKLICCPAVLGDPNNPVVRQILLLVPAREVVLAAKDNKGRDRPPRRVNALDNCSPLSIALLHLF